ncbi:MAG: phytanoyl-CoA dioxygenase family protein [Pseudomonadota bacterium]
MMQPIRKLSKEELDHGIKEVKEQGYTVFENVLTPDQANHYRNLCDQIFDDYSHAYEQGKTDQVFHGDAKVKMVFNLHNKHPDFIPLLFDENLAYLNNALLKEGSYNNAEPYQLHISTARGISGPAEPQQLHIDSNIPGSNYVLMMQMFWALTDMNDENGATRLVPKSHKKMAFAETGKHYDDEVVVNCPKGSLFAVDAGTWHGSSTKQEGSDDRWVIVNGYSRWWMRPTFDASLNTSKDVYDQLTDEQRDILGLKYKMPVDEFERTARISNEHHYHDEYSLPAAKK